MLSPHQSPAAKGEEKHREPLLCAGNQVRRNLCFLFNAMKEQPASVYFDRRCTHKGREQVLKERISSLFRELQGIASENKDREHLLQRRGPGNPPDLLTTETAQLKGEAAAGKSTLCESYTGDNLVKPFFDYDAHGEQETDDRQRFDLLRPWLGQECIPAPGKEGLLVTFGGIKGKDGDSKVLRPLQGEPYRPFSDYLMGKSRLLPLTEQRMIQLATDAMKGEYLKGFRPHRVSSNRGQRVCDGERDVITSLHGTVRKHGIATMLIGAGTRAPCPSSTPLYPPNSASHCCSSSASVPGPAPAPVHVD
ncbi:g8144 [Coccomyxa viridis]|uniref:G8144 protein n=1 Tax=Coccomyxa viridis TaxID=1274662 RepID=A0ABP1G0S0_9CHLO